MKRKQYSQEGEARGLILLNTRLGHKCCWTPGTKSKVPDIHTIVQLPNLLLMEMLG